MINGIRIAGVREPAQPWPVTVREPANGAVLDEVLGGGAEEAEIAVDVASAALSDWSCAPYPMRARALGAIADALRSKEISAELAELIARETGKRLAEARAEVAMSAGFFEWFAAAIHTTQDTLLSVVPGIQHHVRARPLGVVAVSTPWNFPLSIPARKIAAALAAGCTVVCKPSEVAALSALRFTEIIAGQLPQGVLSTLIGEPRAVTSTWLADPRVRGFTFTGSTSVGRSIAAAAVPGLTRCVLELGGNAPFMVLDDADPAQAADLLAIAKYRNNGQSCIAANVAWLPRKRFDEFLDAFRARTAELLLGDPLDDSTTLGPLALPTDPQRLEDLLEAGHGGTVLRADISLPQQGYFARPAICVEPDRGARIVTEETFGPVLAVLGYDEVDEVIAHTNSGELGLAGYVVGTDTDRAAALAARLDVGIAGVNTATPNTPHIPFGGRKSSGIGYEGGRLGLDEFLVPQAMAVAK